MIYGKLTILDPTRDAKGKVLCRCDCGTEKYIGLYNVTSGSTKSCGCLVRNHLKSVHKKNKLKPRLDFDKHLGVKFGRLTLVDANRRENDTALFKCDCGVEKILNFYNVAKGTTNSCGCMKKEFMQKEASKRFKGVLPATFNDLTGHRIGLVTVIKRAEKRKCGSTAYLVRCDCGSEFTLDYSSLRRSAFTRCECGYKKHKLRKILIGMRARCYNPNTPGYKWYGGKGIRICNEWNDFPIKFIDWAYSNGWKDEKLSKHSEVLSIDRIDSDKDYCPENCRWITISENSKKAMDDRWGNY